MQQLARRYRNQTPQTRLGNETPKPAWPTHCLRVKGSRVGFGFRVCEFQGFGFSLGSAIVCAPEEANELGSMLQW